MRSAARDAELMYTCEGIDWKACREAGRRIPARHDQARDRPIHMHELRNLQACTTTSR